MLKMIKAQLDSTNHELNIYGNTNLMEPACVYHFSCDVNVIYNFTGYLDNNLVAMLMPHKYMNCY